MAIQQKPKIYSKAPLPFIGQKRNFIKAFRQVLTDNIDGTGHGWTIVDVFGGSGLLAHNAKRLLPDAHVIYNDYDGYAKRLKHIDDTERLRYIIYDVLADIKRGDRIVGDKRQEVINCIKGFDGFIDEQCVATWLLFSGKQIKSIDELFTNTMYNSIRCTPYDTADAYLDGLEVVSESYTKLMPQYYDKPKTLFLLDPPYLYTAQNAYKQDKYFAMVDFLYLMSLTRPPYIFFSSTKSELLEYMDYLKMLDGEDWERLGGYHKLSINTTLNVNSSYEDNMIYRFV